MCHSCTEFHWNASMSAGCEYTDTEAAVGGKTTENVVQEK